MNSLAGRASECDLAATNHATVAGYAQAACPGAGKATPGTGRASGCLEKLPGSEDVPYLPYPYPHAPLCPKLGGDV